MNNSFQQGVIEAAVEKDAELETFLLSVRGYWTIEQLRVVCIARFGKRRAPSASALYRYINKLKYRAGVAA